MNKKRILVASEYLEDCGWNIFGISMKCKNCKKVISGDDKFCSGCGTKVKTLRSKPVFDDIPQELLNFFEYASGKENNDINEWLEI